MSRAITDNVRRRRRRTRQAASQRGPARRTIQRRRFGTLRRIFGESSSARRLAAVLVLLLALLILRPMLMSALSYHRTAGLLEQRRQEVRDLEQRNALLKERVAYYRTDVFLAERAREYGLVKPGEEAYVIRELAHENLRDE